MRVKKTLKLNEICTFDVETLSLLNNKKLRGKIYVGVS